MDNRSDRKCVGEDGEETGVRCGADGHKDPRVTRHEVMWWRCSRWCLCVAAHMLESMIAVTVTVIPIRVPL